MILAMKLIALATDIDNKEIARPVSFLQCFGYCNFVGTAVFGPFITYDHYQRCVSNRKIVI